MPGRGIEDGGGTALASFYAALARTASGAPGAVTRILHFGDSPVTGDLISSGARARFQTRYGDAGHGFIFAGRPWEWYNHQGVELSSSGWRMLSPLFKAGNDGFYGLGGVCFEAAQGASCMVGTVSRGLGSQVARFDVHIEVQPGGGTLLASIDGNPPVELATAAPRREVRVRSLEVADGPHTLTLQPKGDGEVVLFGVALERSGPGVVYDSLGTNGGTVHFLTLIDERCWRDELRLRAPDLVILNYGTNESGYGYFSFDAYAEDIKKVVRRIREAVPEASILLMAPMDRGTFDESGEIVTLPTIPKIVDTQRAVAIATGCAYFDTYRAMGGEGTMGRWYRGNTHLVTGDLTHPTGVGADLVAGLLVDALEAGFTATTTLISSRDPGLTHRPAEVTPPVAGGAPEGAVSAASPAAAAAATPGEPVPAPGVPRPRR
jgi:lysophospholipase L1-like esterase